MRKRNFIHDFGDFRFALSSTELQLALANHISFPTQTNTKADQTKRN